MIFLIQSDIVTQQLMKEFLVKNPKATHDDAFNESRKTYRKASEDRISNVCYEAKSNYFLNNCNRVLNQFGYHNLR